MPKQKKEAKKTSAKKGNTKLVAALVVSLKDGQYRVTACGEAAVLGAGFLALAMDNPELGRTLKVIAKLFKRYKNEQVNNDPKS
jgi:hypothetical protein